MSDSGVIIDCQPSEAKLDCAKFHNSIYLSYLCEINL